MAEINRMIDLSGLKPGEFSGNAEAEIEQPVQATTTPDIIDLPGYLLSIGGTRFDPRPVDVAERVLGDE